MMTDSLINAWLLAADEEFGGSLDFEEEEKRARPGPLPKSGIPHTYAYRGGWRTRIPGLPSKCFVTKDEARAFVALYVEVR